VEDSGEHDAGDECAAAPPEARGRKMNIIDNIRNEKTICMAYCMKAIISPTCRLD